MIIEQAILLAAGFGVRMRPLTDSCPKSLLHIGGKPMIDSLYAHFQGVGVQHFTINSFFMSDIMESHFADRLDCRVLIESELLESGGAVVNAIREGALTADSFWAVNCDSFWLGDESLRAMQDLWDGDKMDGLLMLCPLEQAYGYHGKGDFDLGSDGRLQRRQTEHARVFCGVQILKASLFADLPLEVFSLNRIYDEAIARGRLYGFEHKGEWWHVGTPEDLQATEILVAKRV